MRDTLSLGAQLANQYWIDCFRSKIDQARLNYIKNNQAQLRADCYNGLQDAIEHDEAHMAGVRIILPSSFTGGPRYMMELYQDAMAMVRKFGKPSYFLTMYDV
jgi:hypothetical protein